MAVTGTNGKTSTVWFTRQLLEAAGARSVSFGTLGIVSEEERTSKPCCLPGRGGVEHLLEQVKSKEPQIVVWEAFSSALAAGVLDNFRPSVAALTTLSRDHLDGHRTWTRYVQAKEHLFRRVLPAGGIAVLPSDRPEGQRFQSVAVDRRQQVRTFGCAPEAHVRLRSERPVAGGTRISVVMGEDEYTGTVPVIGGIMVDNVLAALALAQAAGIDAAALLAGLDTLTPPPGRVEYVMTTDGAHVYVDYAHTPAALEAVLDALRQRTSGQLHLVFGCGGERDRGKRPSMGAVAYRLADVIVVTDDNPRHEEPGRIRTAILSACPGALEVADRREAVGVALAGLQPGDTLVVAGKGHETTQNINGDHRPFSDRDVIERLLAAQCTPKQNARAST